VYPTTGLSGWRSIVTKNVDSYYLMASSSSGTPTAGGTWTSGNQNTTGGTALVVNTWTHLAATFDGTMVRLYVNGVQVASQAQTTLLAPTTGTLQIGANAYGEFFAGRIDEMRIYNRALSAAEISTDMNTPLAPAADTTPPVLSNAQPSGTLAAGTTQATLSVASNENATCRWSASAGTAYGSMANTFATTGATAHSTTVTGLANGQSYAYYVRCQDGAGNANTSDTAIGFSVAAPDTTPPTVSVSAPAAGATVTGTVSVSATASDNVGVVGVQFLLDGAALGAEDTSAPYSVSWNSASATNGAHTITARARDAAGNQTTSAVVDVTVSNAAPDTTPPAVSVSAPADGATVTGTVSVSATASDNVGVVGVQFLLDGAALGAEDTSAPYSVSWNSASATNGAHTITARARDAAGNQTTSAVVNVTVSDTAPPTVTATSPAAGATGVSGTANVTATFSEALDTTTINTSTFELRDPANALVAAVVTYNATSRVATLNPTPTLTQAATYVATVKGGASGVKDAAGNALATDRIWSFTIAPDTTAPTVTATSPASAATGVSRTANITATFSEAMDAATIGGTTFELRDPAGTLVPAVVSYNATNRRATLNPTPTLAALTTYTATVKGGAADPRVKDAAGNALASSKVWSFTTR
jgi:hypothetical protein